MTKTRAALTELEGAILSVIRFAPGATAYRVRQVFLTSRSAEWSGSAGAVYPAIARLKGIDLVRASAEADKRGTLTYRLTRTGKTAHERWLGDVDRAASPGLDPFRTRAGFWSALPPPKRRAMLLDLKRKIEVVRRQLLSELPSLEEGDRIMVDLSLEVQALRLRWLDRYLSALSRKPR
jgi:DNA-binding PadR family transcriptional regulator